MAKKMNVPAQRQAATPAQQRGKEIVDAVTRRVEKMMSEGKLELPPDYAVGTALSAAYLALQETVDRDKRPALQVCTPTSIANALLSMTVQGLSPQRQQCYFVVYGQQLVCMRSYFGTEAVLKRIYPGAEIAAQSIFKGDKVATKIEGGRLFIVSHESQFGNRGGVDKLEGAYAIVTIPREDGGERVETAMMTRAEIEAAWSMGKVYKGAKGTATHNKFTADMAEKTVINKACKRLINSASDSYLARFAAAQDALADDARTDALVAAEANQGDEIDFPEEAPALRDADEVEGEIVDDEPAGDDPEVEADMFHEDEEQQLVDHETTFLSLCAEHDRDPDRMRKALLFMLGKDDGEELTNGSYHYACKQFGKLLELAQ